MSDIKLIYIDLFCGGGGTTTGVHRARLSGDSCAIVACCINHDENAIRSHKSNHKKTLHFTEDITLLYNTSRMQKLVSHVNSLRKQYPYAQVVLWASLECTNFSKAKGGLPRDADSRTLANHLFPYIEVINPDRIQIENVEEFMSWGEIDGHGKPISKLAGTDYIRWINEVCSYGYKFDCRILNAADFGALTSRKRFFGQFCRDAEQIYWPEQTHAENPQNDLFGRQLKKWRAVKEVLDFSDEGESMFDRKKPLVDATWERTYAGLVKFVAGGKKEFLLKYNSMSRSRKYIAPSVDSPCPTISTQGRLNLCRVEFLQKAYSGHPDSKVLSTDKPAGAITTKDHHQVVFVSAYYGNGDNVSGIDKPAPTVTTKDRLALVTSKFLCSYNFKDKAKDINKPCPTLLTKDRLALVQTRFMDQQYGQSKPTDINRPLGCLTANPKYNIVTPQWLMNTNFNNIGSSIEDPAQTITANRKWHYLMNPQFQSKGGSIDRPCFTLIARMDKQPPYLIEASAKQDSTPSFVKVSGNQIVYEVYDTDSDIMKKVKEFMAIYGIVDIKMRMLRILELKKIMGFPEDYVLIGTQAEQKKFIGNAVEVHMATALVEATAQGINQFIKAA
ncbi:MAG: DNA cytosine methyltransferase [Bacteroidales bacterium]|nr:DNA cytosine methyltransferase [Bacteroidales bacterium]